MCGGGAILERRFITDECCTFRSRRLHRKQHAEVSIDNAMPQSLEREIFQTTGERNGEIGAVWRYPIASSTSHDRTRRVRFPRGCDTAPNGKHAFLTHAMSRHASLPYNVHGAFRRPQLWKQCYQILEGKC